MKVNYLFTIVLLLLVSVNLSAQKTNLEWLDGTWTGKGYQVDDQSWTIEFIYDTDRGVSVIKYPSMDCTGQWKFVKKDECAYIFLEKISYGTCDNDVHVYISRVDDDHLSIAYFLPNMMDGVVACAVLTKKK